MLVWVDAQLPPALARWLTRHARVNAQHVADVGLLAAKDHIIFEAARANDVQVFVTKDEDFHLFAERHGPPPQIVWITCGNVRNAKLREIVLAAWPRVMTLLQNGEPLVEIGRRT